MMVFNMRVFLLLGIDLNIENSYKYDKSFREKLIENYLVY